MKWGEKNDPGKTPMMPTCCYKSKTCFVLERHFDTDF